MDENHFCANKMFFVNKCFCVHFSQRRSWCRYQELSARLAWVKSSCILGKAAVGNFGGAAENSKSSLVICHCSRLWNCKQIIFLYVPVKETENRENSKSSLVICHCKNSKSFCYTSLLPGKQTTWERVDNLVICHCIPVKLGSSWPYGPLDPCSDFVLCGLWPLRPRDTLLWARSNAEISSLHVISITQGFQQPCACLISKLAYVTACFSKRKQFTGKTVNHLVICHWMENSQLVSS